MASANRIDLLDSCRGVAAMVVVIHHIHVLFPDTIRTISGFSELTGNLIIFISGLNKEAVLFFFILSGFAIALSSGRINLTTRSGINTYLYKRFKRILPLYWFALALTALCGFLGQWTDDPSFSWYHFSGNLFMMQASSITQGVWFIPFGKNGPLWSISYEMFYYLFFIGWIFLSVRYKNRWVSDQNLFLAAVALSVLAVGFQRLIFIPWTFFMNSFAIWYMGVYLLQLYREKQTNHLLFTFLAAGLFTIDLVGYFNPDLKLAHLSDTLNQLKNGLWIGVLFYAVYAFWIYRPATGNHLLLHWFNRIWQPIGDGSYTIYLIHYPVLLLASELAGDHLLIVFLVTGLLMIASVFIERQVVKQPFLWLKRSYLRA